MAATTLTPIAPGTGWATTGTTVTWTAVDTTNGNQFLSTGREILHYKNTDGAAAHTLTITSQNDSPFNRKGDFSQSIALSAEGCTQMLPKAGWADGSSMVQIPASNDSHFQFWVETVPS